ncbi:mandelate racemase/muconate lactonizing enzyme family protein [Halocatena halophila]|uniref:mandelate racemase/muconate lactonizing enzyme family protein n=1 Tax=Halocatena halophila TaxID=2814576 RepID=UPI002ED43BDF
MASAITIEPFELELQSPLKTADGTIESRRGFLVCLEAEDCVGYGEATPLPGWTESYERCERTLTAAADALSVDKAIESVSATATPAARHGLSLARLDRRAQRCGLGLSQYLAGGGPRDTVSVNATIGDGSVASTVAAARTAVDAGYQCLKCKVGAGGVTRDIARLRAVRSAVGPTIELRADANGAWNRTQAEHVVRAIDDANVAYVEQPLTPGSLSATNSLRSIGTTAIALDEECLRTPINDILRAKAADVLVIKPMAVGGIDRAFRIARVARLVGGVEVVVTTTIDGPIAHTGAIQLAGALKTDTACGLATADRFAGSTPEALRITDGKIAVPEGSGCGLTVAGETGIENWYGIES